MARFGSVALVTAAIAVAALAGCSKPKAGALTADDVKADVHNLLAAFNNHDAAGTVAHDAPDFVGMFHGMANNVGPAADLAITKLQVADPNARIDVSNETVDVAKSGEIAVYRATYTATSTDPKTRQKVVERGNMMVGYRLQPDGSRKVIWDSFSDTPAAPQS
jgi:ketosteroid isomerase-like protein